MPIITLRRPPVVGISEYTFLVALTGLTKGRLMVWGPPGVGKTAIAKKISTILDKWYVHIDCPTLQEGDFAGPIDISRHEIKVDGNKIKSFVSVRGLPPEFVKIEQDADNAEQISLQQDPFMVFDDLPSIQNGSLYAQLQNLIAAGQLNSFFSLPGGAASLGTGNPNTVGEASVPMPNAFATRLVHVYLKPKTVTIIDPENPEILETMDERQFYWRDAARRYTLKVNNAREVLRGVIDTLQNGGREAAIQTFHDVYFQYSANYIDTKGNLPATKTREDKERVIYQENYPKSDIYSPTAIRALLGEGQLSKQDEPDSQGTILDKTKLEADPKKLYRFNDQDVLEQLKFIEKTYSDSLRGVFSKFVEKGGCQFSEYDEKDMDFLDDIHIDSRKVEQIQKMLDIGNQRLAAAYVAWFHIEEALFETEFVSDQNKLQEIRETLKPFFLQKGAMTVGSEKFKNLVIETCDRLGVRPATTRGLVVMLCSFYPFSNELAFHNFIDGINDALYYNMGKENAEKFKVFIRGEIPLDRILSDYDNYRNEWIERVKGIEHEARKTGGYAKAEAAFARDRDVTSATILDMVESGFVMSELYAPTRIRNFIRFLDDTDSVFARGTSVGADIKDSLVQSFLTSIDVEGIPALSSSASVATIRNSLMSHADGEQSKRNWAGLQEYLEKSKEGLNTVMKKKDVTALMEEVTSRTFGKNLDKFFSETFRQMISSRIFYVKDKGEKFVHVKDVSDRVKALMDKGTSQRDLDKFSPMDEVLQKTEKVFQDYLPFLPSSMKNVVLARMAADYGPFDQYSRIRDQRIRSTFNKLSTFDAKKAKGDESKASGEDWLNDLI